MKHGNANKDHEKGNSCCIEAVLTVDDRGQIVLPKNVRERAGMNPGDRLGLIVWENDNKVCCLGLMNAEHLNTGIREVITPMFE